MKAKEIILNEDVNLFEINMSPSSLRQLASNIDARAGMEFEMIVPGGALGDDDDYRESVPDSDYDESCESIDNIVRFFSEDMNSSRAVQRLREKLTDQYEQYVYEQASDSDELYEKTAKNIAYQLKSLDEDEIREMLGLDSDAEISRDEINDAVDKVHEEQIDPYFENAYDDAMQELREQYTEEDWLSEAGYNTMSDISANFDIEWPYWTEEEGSSDNLMDIYSVGEEFENAVGRPVNVSDTYHRAPRNPGEYAMEPDSSLNPDDPSNESGLEFISPPLPIGELISDLSKVKAWADLHGCYTNSSTGLHINVSIENKDFEQLDYVKLALLLGDIHVLKQFGRDSNRYTKSAFEKVKEKAKNPNFDIEPFLDQMREHLSAIGSRAIHSGITEKFISIHPKDGYIEFRSPGGDWLGENFNLIENTLLRFVVALDAALDPNKYRQEYLKKLYKLLQVTSSEDPMKYFAMYVAGTIPMQALKSHIRQIQLTRTKTSSNLTKPPKASTDSSNRVPKTSSNGFSYVPVPTTGASGVITGPDAWVILVGNVPQGRVRGATQSDANEAARQWVSRRSSEWLTDHQGEDIEVVPLSSPHVQELLRQTGR